MRLIDADELKKHKFTTQVANGVELEDIEVVSLGVIDNAPTVEQECYITGAQWNEFMKEHRSVGREVNNEVN